MTVAAPAYIGPACDRCDGVPAYESDAAGAHLCPECYEESHSLNGSTPLNAVVSLSLIPNNTGDEEPVAKPSAKGEVEFWLRQHAEGVIEPTAVTLPPLPDVAPKSMRRVAEFFALVYGLRLEGGEERPAPFACGWVASKLGEPEVTPMTVHRALRKLVEWGVLVRGPDMEGRGKLGAHTYLPGRAG